jgi:Zn ribbon nucleic-acid-binding protein
VVISEEDNRHFYCVKCGRRMAVVDKQIQTVWKPYYPIILDKEECA